MNEYTASNGVIVVEEPDGGVYVRDERDRSDADRAQALREFFQAEADERLGRWRWPENPDYVVYPDHLNTTQPRGAIRVWNERTGVSRYYLNRDGVDGIGGKFDPAAAAYFDARPEPKSIPNEPRTAWVDKYGTDVWHVGLDGVLRCVISPSSDPSKYAPFTRLIPEEQS